MCLYTKYMINRKYLPNKKNKGIPPKCKDMRTYYVPVKCGKCIECRKQKKREWMIRLSEEIRTNPGCLFMTLTFSPEEYSKLAVELYGKDTNLNYEEENELCTKAVRRYTELIRYHTGRMPKHWFITEMGEDYDRIHLHGILWDNRLNAGRWKYGFIYIGTFVTEQTINYITKYMLKAPEKHKHFVGKVLSSKGLGESYIKRRDSTKNRYVAGETNENYRLKSGIKLPLPQYYRNKIYSEEEREKLWIEKQERGYRYIGGEKVNVDDELKYNNLLQYYQRMGIQLFGDNPEEWDAERQRKRLNKMKIYREKMRNAKK